MVADWDNDVWSYFYRKSDPTQVKVIHDVLKHNVFEGHVAFEHLKKLDKDWNYLAQIVEKRKSDVKAINR